MARRSRKSRKQAQKLNQQMIMSFAGVVIIGIVIALAMAGSGEEDAPTVADSRLDLDPVLGNPDAPVTIIEYGAYGCHACEAWHDAGIIETILIEYPDQVNFVFRDFPVIAPSYSRMAARTAQCALDQGQTEFWTYHDAIFRQTGPGVSQNDLYALGDQLGLDGDALRACTEANTHVTTVQYDEQRGYDLGLRGTPTFFVDGQLVYNASPDVLRQMIESALSS